MFSLAFDHLHDTPQIHETYNIIVMASSDKALSDAIRNAVRRMFMGPDRDNLTVNKIREQVETELHLHAGYLKQGSWKQESKSIVKTESVITLLLSCCLTYSLKLLSLFVGKASPTRGGW